MNKKVRRKPGPDLASCTCSAIRRSARAVTNFYDTFLKRAGLTTTQYALLKQMGEAGAISRTALASRVGMDRTTLTRILRPLIRQKLIRAAASDDRRERLLSLAPAGLKSVSRGVSLWRQAQGQLAEELGPQTLKQLHKILGRVEEAVNDRHKPSTG